MNEVRIRRVVYDHGCAVCRSFRHWAKSRDRRAALAFVPNDDPGLEELGGDVDPRRAARTLAVVMPDGKVVWGAKAVSSTLAVLPGPWGVIGGVMALPPLHWLAEPLYWLFARNRGRFARFVQND